ncbi:MAG TPA: hypothetical protein VJ877_06290 [Bacteroidales bacterium]|nr:hypothetical protein [Bacteroidales bacterium]
MKKITAIIAAFMLFGSFANAQDFEVSELPAFRLRTGFTTGVSFDIAPSRTATDSNLLPFSFAVKAGYRTVNTHILGLLGIEYLNDENFIPLGVEVRQNFSNNTWAPFAYAQAGYSFHLKRNIRSRYNTANYAQYEPSLFIKAGAGYSFATTLSEFYVSVGYLYHQLEKIMVEQTGETRTDLTMNGIDITLGFVF